MASQAQKHNAKLKDEQEPAALAALKEMGRSLEVVSSVAAGADGQGKVDAYLEPHLQLSSPAGIVAATPASAVLAAGTTGSVSAGHDIGVVAQANAFTSLNVLSYQAEILSKFRSFCDAIIVGALRYGLRFRNVLPQSFVAQMQQLTSSFEQLKLLGDKMIPQALRELHSNLQTLQELRCSTRIVVRPRYVFKSQSIMRIVIGYCRL